MFRKFQGPYTASDPKKQPARNQLHFPVRNQGIQPVINSIQVSHGTSKLTGQKINNNLKKERPEYSHSITMEKLGHLQDSNYSTNSAADLSNTSSIQENNFTASQNTVPVSLGDVLPAASSQAKNFQYSGKPLTSKPPTSAEKYICGNIICPFTLVMYPKPNTSTAAIGIMKTPPKSSGPPTKTSDVKVSKTAGSLLNSSELINSANETKSNLNESLSSPPADDVYLKNGTSLSQQTNYTTSFKPGRILHLPRKGINTQLDTGFKPNVTTKRKVKVKVTPVTPNAKLYKHCVTFSESSAKVSHNPFIALKGVRNQYPAKTETFAKTKDRQGHQTSAWSQQEKSQPKPPVLLKPSEPRIEIASKHDSVLPVPSQNYGNAIKLQSI